MRKKKDIKKRLKRLRSRLNEHIESDNYIGDEFDDMITEHLLGEISAIEWVLYGDVSKSKKRAE